MMLEVLGADGLTDWLVRQSLYASIAAVVVFGLIKALRLRDPRWLAGLWTIVLLRFLLPVDLAMPWGLGSVWSPFNPVVSGQGGAGSETGLLTPTGEIDQPSGSGGLAIVIALIWAAGVLTLFVIMTRQHLQTRRLLREATPAGPEAQDRLGHWRRVFGIRRPVCFIIGEDRILPFTTGLFSPAIFMSRGQLDAIAPEELDAALVHELAHIRSLDVVWLCLARIVQLLFFFHPVAWWATHQLSQARERCCDIRAVRRSGMSPGRYWAAVLNLLDGAAEAPPRLAMASSLGRSARSLKDRIDAVRAYSHPKANSRIAAYAGVAALSLFLLPMAPTARTTSTTEPSADAGSAGPTPAGLKAARERVAGAREKLERYRGGDFGDRVILRPGGRAICAPDSWPDGVKCDGVFSSGDVAQLIREAEDDLLKAEQAAAAQGSQPRPRL